MAETESYRLREQSRHSSVNSRAREVEASNGVDGLEERPSYSRRRDLIGEKARVLAACSLLQLPIWGMQFHFPSCSANIAQASP